MAKIKFILTPLPQATAGTSPTKTQIYPTPGVVQAPKILIQADPANTAPVYIGDSTVTLTQGIAVPAGQVVVINADVDEGDTASAYIDPSDVYALSASANQKVNIVYLKLVGEDYHG